MSRPRRTRAGQTAAAMPSITTFARVSKSAIVVELPGKKFPKEDYIPVQGSKKRRAAEQETELATTPQSKTGINTKRACVRDENQENHHPDVESIVVSTTKPTKLFQDVLQIAPRSDSKKRGPKRKVNTSNADTHRVSKSTKTPKKGTTINNNNARVDELFQRAREAQEAKKATELPPHLADLASLHRAFLRTITLHFAHNSVNIPVDIRSIAPNIVRAWGKRAVTVEDIRRCIAIQGHNPEAASPFIISDYGRGKICVEVDSKNNGVPINEQKLCRQFEENLNALCAERAGRAEHPTDDVMDVDISLESLSLADLPKAPIADLARDLRSNPIVAKGHRALAELKNGLAAKLQEREMKEQAAINATNPDGTKMSLLDRIRMKQLAKSKLPLPPSGPELERRAALQRVEDVAAMLSMLSLVNPIPRLAFTMPVLLQKLKDSLRMPVSNEEGAACLRLLANEVTPEWIKIVTIGGKENVVIQRSFQPVDRVIKERVAKLVG